MITRKSLRSFGQVKQESEGELFDPSEVYWPMAPLTPGPIEESETYSLPQITYVPEWRKPKEVVGIVGDSLPKFRTGISLRKTSKEAILKGFQIVPSTHVYGSAIPAGFKEIKDLPQPPEYFVDGVPSYGEVAFGQTLNTGVSPYAGRGVWGELESTLTKLSEMYFASKQAKYEAEIKAAQAALVPTPPRIIPQQYEQYIPYALAGGGLLLLLMMRRKPTRSVRRRRRR